MTTVVINVLTASNKNYENNNRDYARSTDKQTKHSLLVSSTKTELLVRKNTTRGAIVNL